jgi:uroporphyrin-III C-methyltransferase/precorrin-2 dehydrogenase/sirohydrochlorin ferrochelatase
MGSGPALYPLFLKLAGRRVVVVGGGAVAASKLRALVEAGADVTVVAPAIVAEIEESGVAIERRAFEPADLDGAWFVVAAGTAAVNRAVADAAEVRRVFVNAVDDPSSASAYLGGIVRRAGVTFAISTDGRAPALAGLLREGLEAVLPDDLDCWRHIAEDIRAGWLRDQVPFAARRPRLLEALNALYAPRNSAAREGAAS